MTVLHPVALGHSKQMLQGSWKGKGMHVHDDVRS